MDEALPKIATVKFLRREGQGGGSDMVEQKIR